MSSSFGSRRIINGQKKNYHTGMDIAAPLGTKVYSAGNGMVVAVFYNLLLTGNTVIVEHGKGLLTMYCHLDKITVTEGEKVTKTNILGTVGKTGRVTGPHLHWVVILNSVKVDPKLFTVSKT